MWEDFIAGVRRNKANLLEEYGGIEGLHIEGLHRHMAEEHPRLEKDGWKFVTLEEVLAKKENNETETVTT
jgi:hypothetical protein